MKSACLLVSTNTIVRSVPAVKHTNESVFIEELKSWLKLSTCSLEDIQQLLSLGELVHLDNHLLHVTTGSTHHAHRQKQVVSLQEVSSQSVV